MRPFFSALIKASCTRGLVNAENEAYSPASTVPHMALVRYQLINEK